jgi:excisionase family DNA binding protein
MAAARSFWTPSDLARAFNVHPKTVLDWIKKNELRAAQTPSKRYRIPVDAVREYCRRHKIAAPDLPGARRVIVVAERDHYEGKRNFRDMPLHFEAKPLRALAAVTVHEVRFVFVDPKVISASDMQDAIRLAGKKASVFELTGRRPWMRDDLDLALQGAG